MKELVVLSGKGGTGKTSLVASFAALAGNLVLADCDVDAADLHLVLKPHVLEENDFSGGKKAKIIQEKCTSCGRCAELCRFHAIAFEEGQQKGDEKTYQVDSIACEGCGVCVKFCPEDAFEFEEAINGQWFVSETRCGPLVHARLGIAEGNSGKLVTVVRSRAQKIAEEKGLGLVLVDGSPGIGCPVIASIAGADLVLLVSEPTPAGEHDCVRVHQLVKHFGIPVLVCINKADLNQNMTEKISQWCRQEKVPVVGEIPYDREVTMAQVEGRSVVENSGSPAAKAIEEIWRRVLEHLGRLEDRELEEKKVDPRALKSSS